MIYISRVTKGNNKITQKYSRSHRGVDIASLGGDNDYVLAHSNGIVIKVVTGKKNNTSSTGNASYGNYVKIKHSDGYYTLYAHLDKIYVKKNEKVVKGQVIGYMGNTGKSYGKHLHFEVRNTKDERINPTKYLKSDLPDTKILYQVYDLTKNKWLPNIEVNTNEYAGNKNNSIGAIYIDNLKYRVHDLKKNKWLPYVIGRKDYAGNMSPIDGIQIYNAIYRVHIKKDKWLPWVSKVDNTASGYAGIIGKEIDLIQIKID